MRKIFMLTVVIGINLIVSFASAYFEPDDHTLNDTGESVFMIGWVYSRITNTRGKIDEDKEIYKINLSDNSKELFYTTTGKNLDSLLLSPDNEIVSVLKDYEAFKKESELLLISSKTGTVLASFRDSIRKYSWSPDGKKIIYITGTEVEGGGIHSDGVWVYDIEKKSKKKISDGADDIQWSDNENIHLIKHSTVAEKGKDFKKPKKAKYETVVYDYKQSRVKPGFINGIKFSLDGKFSILLDPQYDVWALAERGLKQKHVDIYDTQSDKVKRLSAIFADIENMSSSSFLWAANNRLIFVKGIQGRKLDEIYFCDISNDSVLKRINGRIVGTNRNRSKLVIFNGVTFDVIDVQ